MRLILFYYLLFHLVFGTVYTGCSRKCQPSPGSSEEDSNNSTSKTPPPFPCSCSPSCSVYRDCCYDSLYRDSDRTVKHSDTMCLSVEGGGHFGAVAKCPPQRASQFCAESIGHLPPVTSKTTGVTYANVYCAVCHDDGEDLLTWSVELRCCDKHEARGGDRHFVYRKSHLWSQLRGGGRGCLCRYRPLRNSTAFLRGLELRDCGADREVSRCSPSWPADDHHRLCRSYKDPVYSGQRVFKNPHCARCNFQEEAQCVPAVVARMYAQGAQLAQIASHCRRHGIAVCLHYTRAMNKGFEYSFSDIMSIRTLSCVAEPGEMCCRGYRYSYKTKRCMKLHK